MFLDKDETEILAESVKLRGIKTHEDYLIEEIGELLQAISKKNRGKKGAEDNLREEIADVYVLLTTLVIEYGAVPNIHENVADIDEILDRDWRYSPTEIGVIGAVRDHKPELSSREALEFATELFEKEAKKGSI